MPHDYDPKTHRFVRDGRPVSPAAVRGEIDRLTEYVSKQAARIGERYAKGSINIAQFEIDMRELLRSAHIVSSAIGKGGRVRMAASDWGRLGAKLRSEYSYLATFVRRLGRGAVEKIAAPWRAQKYASAVRVSFYQSVRSEHKDDPGKVKVRRILNAKESCPDCIHFASLGWIDPEEQPEIGELQCGPYDLCDLEFEDDYERAKGIFT